ncbi:MAG: ParB N-terminal domain-containing protein [Burkholderiales bacterium]|nr:ParB N-terminal domain-containing protein [Burkholderiales bacterium]
MTQGSNAARAPIALPVGRQLSIDERRRLVAESLRVGNPDSRSGDLPTQADPRQECQIELTVDAIHPYENNPRRAGNERFEDIKASVRANGIRTPLTVTRRPGEAHFIVEAGGNTRLQAIQQLWAETGDARFQKLLVLFRPWQSESHVLTSHLIENELRGEMSFWDKACGIVSLKARLEAEKGLPLSIRQLEEAIKGLGLSINTATLAHYLFATERLGTLGEAVTSLSGLDVKTLQPRLNAMKRHALARASIAEDDLYAGTFEPVFRRFSDKFRKTSIFSVVALLRACEEALALRLGVHVDKVREALDTSPRGVPTPPTSATNNSIAGAPRASQGSPANPSSPGEAGVSTSNAPQIAVAELAALPPGPAPQQALPGASAKLIVAVRAFAATSGVGDFLQITPGAPIGYVMRDAPAWSEGTHLSPEKQRASSLLAALAAHADPDGSAAHGNDADATVGEMALVCWLVDAGNASAGAFLDILNLVRETQAAVRIAAESEMDSKLGGT